MELGDLVEARAELDRLPGSLQNHPQVLEVRWGICAVETDWATALEIARKHLQVEPESLSAWVHQAFAARRAPGGGLQAAWDALFPAMAKFPEEGIVPYNLACYACQLQQLDVARIMFKRAMSLGDKGHYKRMALNDPDLKPLWEEFREL
jgi:tetratricopeptide (TPR) repeat protein